MLAINAATPPLTTRVAPKLSKRKNTSKGAMIINAVNNTSLLMTVLKLAFCRQSQFVLTGEYLPWRLV